MEVPSWATLILVGIGALLFTMKKIPAVLREARKSATAYYDLRDYVRRRRNGKVTRGQSSDE